MSINYIAPPTIGDFSRSTKFFRIIAGPVGSGKTTGCIHELLKKSIEQRASSDGIRYTRWAIVRQTFDQLRSTVLKDIQVFLGSLQTWKVSDKTVYVRFKLADGTFVNSEWLLIPLEDPEDQRRLLSSQLTGAWMSEAIDINVDLVAALGGRCGRFPSALQGGCTWHGIIADTNMPSRGSDWHNKMDVDTPDNWGVFIQPGGMDDKAENLEWLLQTVETLQLPLNDYRRKQQGRTYYEAQINSGTEDWRERYIHARYGADPSGQTVFRSSLKEKHIVQKLHPVPMRNIIISQDFGRNPFGLIGQVDHRDRLLVLEELAAENIGLQMHIRDNLRPAMMQEKYLGLPFFVIGDPSGVAQGQVFDTSPFQHLRNEGFNAYPAPTNDIDKRLAAVENYLLRDYADGPSILISEEGCPILCQALRLRYRYAKRRNGQLAPLPDKTHPWSDAADALQYLCLAAGGGLGDYVAVRMAQQRQHVAPPRQRIGVGGWT